MCGPVLAPDSEREPLVASGQVWKAPVHLQLLEAGDGLGLCWVLAQEAAGTGWQEASASTKVWSGTEKARLLARLLIPCSVVQGAERVTAPFSFPFSKFSNTFPY